MDRIIFITIAIVTIAIVIFVGDALYIGLWYYIAIPAIAYLICIPFKPEKFFLSGAGIAILLAYTPYFIHNLLAKSPEGLIGLGHLYSLPGLYIGIIFAVIYLQHHKTHTPLIFMIGLCGTLGGFLINQFISCNTLLYCNALIWPLSLFTLK